MVVPIKTGGGVKEQAIKEKGYFFNSFFFSKKYKKFRLPLSMRRIKGLNGTAIKKNNFFAANLLRNLF